MYPEFKVSCNEEGDLYLHVDGWEHQEPKTKEQLLDLLAGWVNIHSTILKKD